MTKQDGFIVINLATAECETGFTTREQAKIFIDKTGVLEYTQADFENGGFDISKEARLLIMPYYINETPEYNELTIYNNSNKYSQFSSVADYYEDTLNNDFINTQDIPIRLQFAI